MQSRHPHTYHRQRQNLTVATKFCPVTPKSTVYDVVEVPTLPCHHPFPSPQTSFLDGRRLPNFLVDFWLPHDIQLEAIPATAHMTGQPSSANLAIGVQYPRLYVADGLCHNLAISLKRSLSCHLLLLLQFWHDDDANPSLTICRGVHLPPEVGDPLDKLISKHATVDKATLLVPLASP